MISKENTRVNITIPKKLYKLIKDQALYEGRSASNMVAKILKDYYNYVDNKED